MYLTSGEMNTERTRTCSLSNLKLNIEDEPKMLLEQVQRDKDRKVELLVQIKLAEKQLELASYEARKLHKMKTDSIKNMLNEKIVRLEVEEESNIAIYQDEDLQKVKHLEIFR